MSQRPERARRAWILSGHLALALWGLLQTLSPLVGGLAALPSPLAWLIGSTAATAALTAALGLVRQSPTLELPALIVAAAAPVAYIVTLGTLPDYQDRLLAAALAVAIVSHLAARICELRVPAPDVAGVAS